MPLMRTANADPSNSQTSLLKDLSTYKFLTTNIYQFTFIFTLNSGMKTLFLTMTEGIQYRYDYPALRKKFMPLRISISLYHLSIPLPVHRVACSFVRTLRRAHTTAWPHQTEPLGKHLLLWLHSPQQGKLAPTSPGSAPCTEARRAGSHWDSKPEELQMNVVNSALVYIIHSAMVQPLCN